jgi:hypothetical protein
MLAWSMTATAEVGVCVQAVPLTSPLEGISAKHTGAMKLPSIKPQSTPTSLIGTAHRRYRIIRGRFIDTH